MSLENITKIADMYRDLSEKCAQDSVIAGIGLKTSLRPDRRLQLVHEGNILKSIFAHLKMRYWNKEFSFKYYGASSEILTSGDDEALQTAATHTIVNVDSTPRAVEGIFPIHSIDEINRMFDSILKKETSEHKTMRSKIKSLIENVT